MTRFFLLSALIVLTGCGRNMYDQARYEPYDASPMFEDGTSSRLLPEGTVSRSRGEVSEVFFTGQGENGLATELPLELTEAVLQRGQERYNIYCSPCHNYSGNGEGMIVQKGFVQPTSFHDPRLKAAPVGYFFQVITNGFGRMYSYASRVPPEDRWAIAAYIRTLQYSQAAPVADLPEDVRERLEKAQQNAEVAAPGKAGTAKSTATEGEVAATPVQEGGTQ